MSPQGGLSSFLHRCTLSPCLHVGHCATRHSGSWCWVPWDRCHLWVSSPITGITAGAFSSPVSGLPPPVHHRHQSNCSESYHFPIMTPYYSQVQISQLALKDLHNLASVYSSSLSWHRASCTLLSLPSCALPSYPCLAPPLDPHSRQSFFFSPLCPLALAVSWKEPL